MQLKKMQSNIYRQYALLKRGLEQRSATIETEFCEKNQKLTTNSNDRSDRLKQVIKWQAKGH
ncbi:hypothetical protein ACWN8V_05450 [Vagococcus elongatus]|uniref:Uncharacterized protein n=1 Tax=Vagococcus elongatus TaxID=180344 RepID=A0A430AX27_9ENTE|nr:hypothetical protein [Vagococcus elongatus]RSU12603.1 hypothetical protein CBF29_05590 [Vagococcus elongatus]